jgi:hypothetical protein
MSTESQGVSTRGLRLIGQGGEAEVFECPDGRVLELLRGSRPRTGLVFWIPARKSPPDSYLVYRCFRQVHTRFAR